MVKSYTSQPEKTEKTEQRDRFPRDLLFYLVTSILLHAIVLFGMDYWLQVFKPNREKELSQPIPIEYLEVPPEPAKKPPETSKRAARDSANGGKVKQKSSIAVTKSALPAESKTPTVRPQTLPEPNPATVSPPQPPTQQPAISPNSSSQQQQSQPSQAIAPLAQQTEPQIARSEVPTNTSPEPQLPQKEENPSVVTPTPEIQPAPTPNDTTALTNKLRQSTLARRVRTSPSPATQPTPTPDTTALTNKLRQSTLARRVRTSPSPATQPTPTPDTTALTNKLRQSTLARRVRTSPSPATQPTPTPDTTALTNKLRQSTLARRVRTSPSPATQPTPTPNDTTALNNKLRQSTLARRVRTSLSPEVQPTPTPNDTTALNNKLRQSTLARRVRTSPTPATQPTPTPSAIPSQPKPQQTTIARSTTFTKPKPSQTNLAPTTKPANRTQKLVASPSSGQLQPRSTQSTPPKVKPSRTSGAASRLGGPVSLSSRNIENLAALPDSNPSNRAVDGMDARKDDLGPYLAQLQQRVKQQWIPGLTQSSRRTVLYFTISRSGRITGLQVAQPSGFDAIDEAALNAVQRAAPFAPLPTTYSGNYLSIEFTFSINVYGQLDLFMGQ
ncbi:MULTISPECIES: energy transducer TonB [Nostocales]|uniref:Energy transducer TonB n=2 Tax=Nostocales TaxID=1161 RepID=A0ABW8WIA6_9CYAN